MRGVTVELLGVPVSPLLSSRAPNFVRLDARHIVPSDWSVVGASVCAGAVESGRLVCGTASVPCRRVDSYLHSACGRSGCVADCSGGTARERGRCLHFVRPDEASAFPRDLDRETCICRSRHLAASASTDRRGELLEYAL